MCNSVLRYNWFETNLASFMGKYPLPAYYDGEDLLAFVRQYKGKYMSDFTELLISDCRSSPIHQDRYDENIEAFHLLFLDFLS